MGKAIALKEHFPLIREKGEIMREIKENPQLARLFEAWNRKERDEFLDFCTGVRGMKILYDSFFKEALNCEYDVSRLEFFLCTVLKKKVKILRILPNDSTRIADEVSLLITDIVVELEDGSLANVEIQKIGYAFPGPRCACYGADMLLRQYKRVRGNKGNSFSYNDIKNVYLIVLYEQSPKEFKALPDVYYHHGKQVFDSGLELELLEEFIMIPLDIFKKSMHNKPIETALEAWLTFLSEDSPEKIVELITAYPEFKAMYESLYGMCLNTERVMEMFSEELKIMDRNTVQYMIDEQQKELDENRRRLDESKRRLDESKRRLDESKRELDENKRRLDENKRRLAEKDQQLDAQNEQIKQMAAQMEALKKRLEELEKRA